MQERTLTELRNLLEQLIQLPADDLPNDDHQLVPEQIMDVVDVIAKPRGRPRKIRNAITRTRKQTNCTICQGKHETSRCVVFQKLEEVVAQFAEYAGGQRRCGICSAPGHNARRCPIKQEVLLSIAVLCRAY